MKTNFAPTFSLKRFLRDALAHNGTLGILLTGSIGMAGYDDYSFHLTASLLALPLMTIPSASIAGLMTRLTR